MDLKSLEKIGESSANVIHHGVRYRAKGLIKFSSQKVISPDPPEGSRTMNDEEKRILALYQEKWTTEIHAQLGDPIETVTTPTYEATRNPYRYLVDNDYCLQLLTDSTVMSSTLHVAKALEALRQGLTPAFVDAACWNGAVSFDTKVGAKFRIELLQKLTRPITVEVIKLP